MKVLITGGCGFIGSSIAVYFKQHLEDITVFCFDNLYRKGSELNKARILEHGAIFIQGDVRKFSDFDEVPKVDLVIDAAAEPSVLAGLQNDLEYVLDTNLQGTIHTLYFARRHQAAIIFLSTSRVYPHTLLEKAAIHQSEQKFAFSRQQTIQGLSDQGVSEEFPLTGLRSIYGATKLSSELLIQEFAHQFQLPSIIFRCGVVSGPFQMGKEDQGVVVLWMARHFWKKQLQYIGFGGSGFQARDILHVQDLCRLVVWAARHHLQTETGVFNVGGGLENSISLLELTALCREITGNTVEITANNTQRPGDIPLYVTDNSFITETSGWTPSIGVTSILEDIHIWLLQNEEKLKPVLL